MLLLTGGGCEKYSGHRTWFCGRTAKTSFWHEGILLWHNYCFYLPPRRRPGDGRYCKAPPVCLFSFCTVTRKRDVFSRNFAGTCTMSWGCAV